MSNDLTYRCVSYPHFEPDHTWLRKMLLFVDEIHRIVPRAHKLSDSDELKALNDMTGEAVKVCQADPYIRLSQSQQAHFTTALDRLLKAPGGKAVKPRVTVGAKGIKRVPGWERLHMDKMYPSTRQLLLDRNLLFRAADEHWYYAPKEVGNLVVGMLATNAAQHRGFDAVTDQPLACALNNMYQLDTSGTPTVEGAIASAVASVHVPDVIAKLSIREYVELRKQHGAVRAEYATRCPGNQAAPRQHHRACWERNDPLSKEQTCYKIQRLGAIYTEQHGADCDYTVRRAWFWRGRRAYRFRN
jgi:hypothetical protein